MHELGMYVLTYRFGGDINDNVDEKNDFFLVGAQSRSILTSGGQVEGHHMPRNKHFLK